MTKTGFAKAGWLLLVACWAVSHAGAQPPGGGQGRQRPPGSANSAGESRKRMQQNRTATQGKTDEQRRQLLLKMQQLRQQRGAQVRPFRNAGLRPALTNPETVSTATLPIQSNTFPSTSDTVTTWTIPNASGMPPWSPPGISSSAPVAAFPAAGAAREGTGPLREMMEVLAPGDRAKMAAFVQGMTAEQRQALRREIGALPAGQRRDEVLRRAGIDPSRAIAPAGSTSPPDAPTSTAAFPAATPTPRPLVIAARGDGQARFSSAAIGATGSMPRIGDVAPALRLTTTDGSVVTLDEFRGRTLVLQFGSLTCPVYRGNIAAMKSLREKAPPNVAFLLVYTTEAHPSGSPSPYANREWVPEKNTLENALKPQTTTLEQRLANAAELRSRFGETGLVAVDGMDNAAWKAFGSRPNSAFVIGPDGRIVLAQEWLEPVSLSKALPK